MFLLFLCLGTASVKAQVRIGGNTPPNPAAALDLNAAEGAIGTKGLALPRVNLTSNKAILDGTTANITGMLVYNTGGSLKAGIYYWDGNIWTCVVSSPSGLVDTSILNDPKFGPTTMIYDGSSWVYARYQSVAFVLHNSIPANTIVTDSLSPITTGCLTLPVAEIVQALNTNIYMYRLSTDEWVFRTWSTVASGWYFRARCWRRI